MKQFTSGAAITAVTDSSGAEYARILVNDMHPKDALTLAKMLAGILNATVKPGDHVEKFFACALPEREVP